MLQIEPSLGSHPLEGSLRRGQVLHSELNHGGKTTLRGTKIPILAVGSRGCQAPPPHSTIRGILA